MKTLILSLLLLSTHAWSKDEVNEIPQEELNKKLISTVKEFEVEGMLDKTAEFKDCKDENQFSASASDAQRETNAQKAVECFKKKLASKKNADELAKLSDSLGLQNYGLVGSKSTKDLTEYFGDRMYKALTGVDRKEKDAKKLMESMKFKNQKLVDQKVFFQLYRTQLMKNSLFEVSRFCFENFRLKTPTAADESNFGEYWKSIIGQDYQKADPKTLTGKFTDTGTKGFGSFNDTGSKDAIYQNIFASLNVNETDKFALVQDFFTICSNQILPLCAVFEETTKKNSGGNANANMDMTGAHACLAKDKLQKYRKAVADLRKVIEGMEKDMNGEGKGINVANLAGFYDGATDGENSIDNLTNYASSQFIEGVTPDEQLKKKQAECSDNPENSGCEDFIVIDDSGKKIEHNMDMDLRLKKEVELARIKALKDADSKKLEEYLKENGYLDLLEKYRANNKIDLESEIGTIFEAKRLAAVAELKNKIGSRQMSEADAGTGTAKKDNIKKNAQESKEEKVRMAQVVMFNNIITGYIGLSNEKGDDLGRNINVVKSEVKGLETANVDSSLFNNLKTGADGESPVQGGLFKDAKILDSILGEKPADKNN